MKTYGFHGIHGRAFPVAEGIKMARPDLHVFVSTGDGDCCSIGAAHWIHALRYNMNITVILHDNHVYGLTKKQASPTSPRGPEEQHHALRRHARADEPADGVARRAGRVVHRAGRRLGARGAVRHRARGLQAPRLLVRAHPAALPRVHAQGLRPLAARPAAHAAADPRGRPAARARACAAPTATSASTTRCDIDRAREIASLDDPIPVGILYRNPDAPCYEDLRHAGQMRSPAVIRAGLEPRVRQVHRLARRRPNRRSSAA